MKMHEDQIDQQFVKGIKQELDRSCQQLDAATLSRLNRIRHAALASSVSLMGNWGNVFASAIFSVVLMVVLAFYLVPSDELVPGNPNLTELEAMEILSDEESLDFYQDFEFYQWLSMNEDL
jgi:hypothetical protein